MANKGSTGKRERTPRSDGVREAIAAALTEAATKVAHALLAAKAIPGNASRDAAHVGICAVHGVLFLLTWNFKHLANAKMQDRDSRDMHRTGL